MTNNQHKVMTMNYKSRKRQVLSSSIFSSSFSPLFSPPSLSLHSPTIPNKGSTLTQSSQRLSSSIIRSFSPFLILPFVVIIISLLSLTCEVNCSELPLSSSLSSKSRFESKIYRSSFSTNFPSSQSQSSSSPFSSFATPISSGEDEEYRRIDAIYHKSLDEHLPDYPHEHARDHHPSRESRNYSQNEGSNHEEPKRKRKRSNKHVQICRREFLKPLEKRESEADLVFTGTIERIKRNPSLKLANGWYRANVRVKQVIKGNIKLEGSKVIVEGFGSKKICDSDVKMKDSRIFLVNEGTNGRLRLNSSLIRINLDNLKKVLSAAKLIQDEFILTLPTTTTEVPRYDIMWSPTTPSVFFMKPLSSITRSDWPISWSRRPLTTTKVDTTTTTKFETTKKSDTLTATTKIETETITPVPNTTAESTTITTTTTTESSDNDDDSPDTELFLDQPIQSRLLGPSTTTVPKDPISLTSKRTLTGSHSRSFDDDRIRDRDNVVKTDPRGRNIRRRSNHHLAICRREFLRPLEAREEASDLVFTGIVERVHKRVSSDPYQRSRREHRDHLNYHHSRHHRGNDKSKNSWYRGIVRVKRVIKGNKDFEGNRLMIEGFGSRKICESDVKSGESRIFMVNSTKHGRFKITSSLMRIDYDNLKKVISAARSRF